MKNKDLKTDAIQGHWSLFIMARLHFQVVDHGDTTRVVCTASLGDRRGSDNDKSQQTEGTSQQEIAYLPEMCDSRGSKRGHKLQNEMIQEAHWNRWNGTHGPGRRLSPCRGSPVERLLLSPPDSDLSSWHLVMEESSSGGLSVVTVSVIPRSHLWLCSTTDVW